MTESPYGISLQRLDGRAGSLARCPGPRHESGVPWNFEKFLVGRDGQMPGRFVPEVAPDDPALVAA
jgi:glutathione peroxidase-family protein